MVFFFFEESKEEAGSSQTFMMLCRLKQRPVYKLRGMLLSSDAGMGRIVLESDSLNLKYAPKSTEQGMSRAGLLFREAKFLLLSPIL